MSQIYCAGPMTGYEAYNFISFFRAERLLAHEGWEPGNPARWDLERLGYNKVIGSDEDAKEAGNWVATQPFDLKEAAEMDLKYLIHQAKAIALLPGWENSKGARAESATAEWMGLEKIFLTQDMLDGVI